ELRGCIGVIVAQDALYKNIMEYAVTAAVKDPRFPPVEAHELDELELEISALGPIERLDDIKKIEVGRHGLIIKKGYHQGLLLPQVPIEWGWDKTQFLEHTCRKAGLKKNAYKNPETEIYYFTADVFTEHI
ncbi:MAG: AmmeMemoRadiSam system protein A, partial [Bacteriovoracia bacterium]